MTTPGHDLDRYRRLRVIPRTRDPRIRSDARDAHGNPDLLADLALRWVDEAVDGWFERAGRRVARVDGGGVEPAGCDARDELLGDAGGSLAPEDPVSEQATAVRQCHIAKTDRIEADRIQ